ncbi:MAG: hypothetical protein SWY16_11700 [Cyanobacteriota bacterium]|nr:hypothetical protein [Cyanobacteriota bacterium]
MGQALSEWRQFLNWIQRESRVRLKSAACKLPSPARLKESQGWLFGMGVLIMVLWNPQLTVSLGMGVLAMFVSYSIGRWNWHPIRQLANELFSSANRQLTIAIVCGILAALGTYLVLALWMGMESHALALAVILQGMATLAILAVLLRAELVRGSRENSLGFENFDGYLDRLADVDPLCRTIAVRQLIRALNENRLDRSQQQTIAESFRLMLRREPEPIVRNAILEGLTALGEFKPLSAGIPEIAIPAPPTRSSIKEPRYPVGDR